VITKDVAKKVMSTTLKLGQKLKKGLCQWLNHIAKAKN
jgi:hypothetical protein